MEVCRNDPQVYYSALIFSLKRRLGTAASIGQKLHSLTRIRQGDKGARLRHEATLMLSDWLRVRFMSGLEGELTLTWPLYHIQRQNVSHW